MLSNIKQLNQLVLPSSFLLENEDILMKSKCGCFNLLQIKYYQEKSSLYFIVWRHRRKKGKKD